MVRRIPRKFINDLLTRTDIAALIDARLPLKKKGKNFYACCPFHHEKTPSFSVNDEKQFYHCFGCGAHGNVIDFLMKFERLEFVESIEELASIHGLEVPSEKTDALKEQVQQRRHQRYNLYQWMEKLNAFYQKSLKDPAAYKARHYLAQRGLNDSTIELFSIGFALPGWSNLLDHFGHENTSELKDAGMLVTSDNGRIYDRFRERITFPIRDKRGNVIAFGGRVINQEMPKYLNSPETDIFHKGRQLYGLYEAKLSQSDLKLLLVVEGYMDVLTLAQFGIRYAVASLGTATTEEHIQLMFRTTDQIVCCYDGDKAGRKAAWRVLETALPYLNDGRQLRFIFLPEGEDPDTLLRSEGKVAFEQRIEQAQSFSAFLFDTVMLGIELNRPEGRAKLSSLALPLINQVPGETLRLYLRQELGKKLGILEDHLLDRLLPKKGVSKMPSSKQLKPTTMRVLIALLIQNPRLAKMVPSLEDIQQARIAGLPLFIELLEHCLACPGLNTAHLLELYRGKECQKQLEQLSAWGDMEFKEEKMIQIIFTDALNHLFDSILQQRLEILIARARAPLGLNTSERQEVRLITETLSKKK
ncbi:DNA primase [Candidatus Williamhamiltonella defendens]|uniref:DNA primase n=1 Tax=Hamiltonella defensa subsp. Acyrthosiphon pisum (strain 5AT) TaxID=572265 RepID=C4K492_HAMD5|nr:DNA primase [Candidatus Hamiltonella defensa]ACQ67385.1 DNA biosynthesis; DNA primase [Candidatus Hamiltonella defensa 5AT (Acyrthosiphon pisum)]ATW22119.1 DNA primase [Candidatus Hamiltonella defensa]